MLSMDKTMLFFTGVFGGDSLISLDKFFTETKDPTNLQPIHILQPRTLLNLAAYDFTKVF